MTEAVANERLQSLIARIEKLEAEKAEFANDIKEIYQEAKSAGFDTKVLRQVVRLRKMDRQRREEEEQLRDLYLHALGELSDLPLGKSAMERAGVIPEQDDEVLPRVRMGVSIEEVPSLSGVVFKALHPDSAACGAETVRTETRTISGAVDSLRQMMAGAG